MTAIQSVEDWLSAAGASISGWHLVKATGVSADGTVVVGQGEDVFGTTKAFIARVNADGGTGIIDPIVWMGTLAGARDGFYAGQSQMALPLEGAHHRTLLSLDNGGQRFGVWLTGEGTYRTEGENARLGLGEVGIYTDLLPGLRIGLGAAKSDQQQNLPYSGAARLDGRYWLAEVGWQPRSMPVQLSLTTMAGKWDTRINRAYENGGGIDVSPGDAPVEGHSVRLRLDVPDAWTFGRTAMTPYAAYTETHTRMAAYAESGGAFPASYQAQEHTAREARLGLRLSRTMTETVAVHGHIEAVHRFDRTGARLSGSELSGLLPFDFAGAKIKRNSMRLGLDMDYRLALGTTLTASFMTATPGEDPVVSAAVGVRFSF